MIESPEKQFQFSNHYAQVKGQIVYIYFNGDLTYANTKALLDFIEECYGKAPYYAICDIHRQGTTTFEARKLLSTWTKDKQLRASAMIGGSPIAKALTILVGNAIRLFSKNTIAIRFVKDMAEATAWIADQQKRDSVA